MDKIIKPGRLFLFAVIVTALAAIYTLALYKLQIVEGEAYYESSQNSIVTRKTVTAPRGNILDRYGRLLVSNRMCNNLTINGYELEKMDDNELRNEAILQLTRAVTEAGDTYTDTLPITKTPPFEYEYTVNIEAMQRTRLEAFLKARGLAAETTAVELMAYFRSRYGIDANYTAEETRIIAGVRYEVNIRYIINTSDYIFAEDVSIELLSRLMESDMPLYEVEQSYIREYKTIYASHLIGYVAQMYGDEYDKYKEQGYLMNAYVGREGAERAFESYLHGQDGRALVTSTATGTVTNIVYEEEPIPGDHVYLTIDSGLQEAGEQALANGIRKMNLQTEANNLKFAAAGERNEIRQLAEGGALVAIDIKTGEPLCLVSYPSYDLATFLDTYNELLANPLNPLFNRALMGTYAPGSTFKMVTALAALDLGKITTNTTIEDEGIYREYEWAGYAPKCWLYPDGTHGSLNVSGALEHSCNYFFYSLSDMLKVDNMAEYAKRFGLGENTGIELPEYKGFMASPESKAAATRGDPWYEGDNLQAGIGQGYSLFTPLQLAEYVAAVVNDGQRYSASVLKTVRSYDYAEKLYNRQPEVLSEAGGEPEYYEAIRQGMHAVVKTGTAMSHFFGYGIDVAAKTGTAQLGENVTNNGIFVCYAPYDDPQIAIAIVVEKGGSGSSLSYIAQEVLNYYFNFSAATTALESEMQLLR